MNQIEASKNTSLYLTFFFKTDEMTENQLLWSLLIKSQF